MYPSTLNSSFVQHKFLIPCLMDAMFKFHKFGFKSVAVVCDGASSNLSMIKVLSGSEAKEYGYKTSATFCMLCTSLSFMMRICEHSPQV